MDVASVTYKHTYGQTFGLLGLLSQSKRANILYFTAKRSSNIPHRANKRGVVNACSSAANTDNTAGDSLKINLIREKKNDLTQ